MATDKHDELVDFINETNEAMYDLCEALDGYVPASVQNSLRAIQRRLSEANRTFHAAPMPTPD